MSQNSNYAKLKNAWSDRVSLSALKNLQVNRLATFGIIFVMIIVFLSIFPSFAAPYDPTTINPDQALQEPSLSHLFGTDQHGRDVLSRVVFGARASVLVGCLTVLIAGTLGIPQGIVAGFYGNRVDDVIMRFNDAVLSFPSLILAFLIVGIVGSGLAPVIIALGLVYSPRFARIGRSSTLSIKENQYVVAAEAAGASNTRIMSRHILPNAKGPLIVEATLVFAYAILNEAAFSYLGLGAQPPTVTWGRMIKSGQVLLANAPWISLAATLFIALSVLSYNAIGDALRESYDPRSGIK